MNRQRQQQILEFIEQARNRINIELRHPAVRRDEYTGIWEDDLMSSAGPGGSLRYIDHLLKLISVMIDYEDEQLIDDEKVVE
jgi:hypothetical protein